MPCQRVRTTAVCIAVATGPLLFAFDPAQTWWFPSCPFRAITGWLCPLCGTLRALHALLRGAPGAALALNPLAILGLLAGLAALAGDALDPARRSRFERLLGLCLGAPGLVLLIAFGVLRNVRGPFAWLAG